MKEMRFDSGQRAAIDIRRNAVVSAGAGSGKTSVLAERYCQLVEKDKLPIASILTLTFTRKAAVEMYGRIYARLCASSDPFVRAQLQEFDRARIMTLDSFCAAVTRGACQRYGIPPDFSMDEPRLHRLADACAIDVIMDNRKNEALRTLVASYGFDRIRSDFLVHVAEHHLLAHRLQEHRKDAERQIAYFEREALRHHQCVIESVEALLALDFSASASKTLQRIRDYLPRARPRLDANPLTCPESELVVYEELASAKSFTTPGSNVTDSLLLQARPLVVQLKEDAAGLLSAAECARFKDLAIAIGEMLDDFAARYAERKRQAGLLSFADVSALAVDILRDDHELRAWYKKSIRAIMIDEFQDNNLQQKELLFLLAESEGSLVEGIPTAAELDNGKLFFVGDEKQSIYRFRGADVSVFRALAGELSLGKPESGSMPELATNYRSTRHLVDFFNAFFPGSFGQDDNPWDARFSSIQSNPEEPREGPSNESTALPVELLVLENTDLGEDEESSALVRNEAFAVVQRIVALIERESYTPRDIAILFRSTGSQPAYEAALSAAGLPFVSADPRGFYLESIANDFYAFLRLLIYPNDTHAFTTVLRSPFVGLGDVSLSAIFLSSPDVLSFELEPDDALFEHSRDRTRWDMAKQLYQDLGASTDENGSAALVSRLWNESGYRLQLLSQSETAPYISHYEEFHELALDADARGLSLSAFLDEMQPKMGQSEKLESEQDAGAENAIHLSTVHKSKGLEYPVVVLANCGGRGRLNTNSAPYYRDPEYGIVVNFRDDAKSRDKKKPNALYDRNKEQEKSEETAELRRLLYVAATRAEQRLFFALSLKPCKELLEELAGLEGEERAQALLDLNRERLSSGEKTIQTFADMISQGIAGTATEQPRYRIISIPRLSEVALREEYQKLRGTVAVSSGNSTAFALLSAATCFPHVPEALLSTSVTRIVAHAASPDFSPNQALSVLDIDDLLTNDGLSAWFGTLCHYLIQRNLEHLPFDLPATFLSRISGSDLSDVQIERLYAAARALASGFLESESGKRALSANFKRAEAPFILPLGTEGTVPVLVSGTLDLLYEDEEGCHILDFKSDRTRPDDDHALQLAYYRAAASAFSDKPITCAIWYLRDRLLVPVVLDFNKQQLYDYALNSARINADEAQKDEYGA